MKTGLCCVYYRLLMLLNWHEFPIE